MFPDIIVSLLVFLSTFGFYQCGNDLNNSEWLKGLRKYIIQDSSTHQTLFIINHDLFRKETKVERILQEIKPIKPSIHFLVRNVTETAAIQDSKQLSALRFSRTTFFIIIDYHELSIAQETIKLIKDSLKGGFRPKCMVLQCPEVVTSLDPNKKNFFRNAWNNQFLDVTILEIVGETSKVQHYNPFTKIFSTSTFTSKTSLFPDKLQNMNGFQLEAACDHSPPDIYIQRNSSGYPISIAGPSLRLFEAFATNMNFKLHVVTGYGEKWPLNFLFDRLFQNKIQLIPISLMRSKTEKFCRDSCLEHLATGLGSLNGLKAKMQNHQIHFAVWSFLYSLCPIAVFSGILWLLMYILKRYSTDWNLPFTVQVVLGLTVPEQPQNWKLRIIFAYIVIVSFMYSSQLHAMITRISLRSESDSKLTTLAELNKSDTALIMNPVFLNWMERDIQKLSMVRNSLKRFSSTEECAHHAVTDRNISCVMTKRAADYFQMYFRNQDGNSLINIVEEPFAMSPEGFYLEPGSPYAERFRGLLLRLMAFGVFEKLNTNVVPTTSFSGMAKEALDDLMIGYYQLFPVLVTILLVGYLISGIVFMIEIIFGKIRKP